MILFTVKTFTGYVKTKTLCNKPEDQCFAMHPSFAQNQRFAKPPFCGRLWRRLREC